MSSVPLCALSAVAEGGARAIVRPDVAGGRELILVRRGGAVFAYVNVCPHRGTPLDWVPGRFLDVSGTLLQCATHGALFRIEDGVCVAGPCPGARLEPWPVAVRADTIFAE